MQLTHAADMHVPAALTDYSGLNHSICLPGRAGSGLFPKSMMEPHGAMF